VRGHSEADRFAYVPKALLVEWEARDPIVLFERRLRAGGFLTDEADQVMRADIAREIEDGLAWAEASPEPVPPSVTEGVYADGGKP
jgi:TPP-dependent pyruvate/acetoin dehydrogenase alpha subunit